MTDSSEQLLSVLSSDIIKSFQGTVRMRANELFSNSLILFVLRFSKTKNINYVVKDQNTLNDVIKDLYDGIGQVDITT